MSSALIHKSDGTSKVVEFSEATSYLVLSEAVGGLFQLIHLTPNLDLWVNENYLAEAEAKNLKMNAVATAMYSASTGVTYPILGDVVFTGGTDEEGNTLGLDEGTLANLTLIIEKSAPLVEKINNRNGN